MFLGSLRVLYDLYILPPLKSCLWNDIEKMAQIAPNCEIYHLHKVKAFRQCVTKGVYDGLVCQKLYQGVQ